MGPHEEGTFGQNAVNHVTFPLEINQEFIVEIGVPRTYFWLVFSNTDSFASLFEWSLIDSIQFSKLRGSV